MQNFLQRRHVFFLFFFPPSEQSGIVLSPLTVYTIGVLAKEMMEIRRHFASECC